jgi:rhodanese-related sulfurtransferase
MSKGGNKKRLSLRSMFVFCIVVCFTATALAEAELPKAKQTRLGLYVTAKQAYEKYTANPESIHILDVRTPGEYVFVGHAPMAVNIPIKFQELGLNDQNKVVMPENKNFVADVQKKYSKTDTILIMCRSGSRSALAVNKLAEAGFTKVYNIIDGFEGDHDKEGKRTVNGWKNSGNPWTYKYKASMMYIP